MNCPVKPPLSFRYYVSLASNHARACYQDDEHPLNDIQASADEVILRGYYCLSAQDVDTLIATLRRAQLQHRYLAEGGEMPLSEAQLQEMLQV